jgi:hypothetical protein
VDDRADLALVERFRDELGEARFAPCPIIESLLAAPTRRRRLRGRSRAAWTIGALVGAVAIFSVVFAIGQGGGSQGILRHVGQWTLRVDAADAAVRPNTVGRAVIRQAAVDEYLSLRVPYRTKGVYLGDRPVVQFASVAAGAMNVRFPSGTQLTVPHAPADVWYVEVASASDPSNPAAQVDMVFNAQGSLLRAFARNQPGLISKASATRLSASQLADLQWAPIDVTKTDIAPATCAGSGCGVNDSSSQFGPNPSAQFTMEAASDNNGGMVIEVTGTNLNPNDPYFLDTEAGVLGSAQSDSNGSLVAVFTVDAQTLPAAQGGPGNGIVEINGAGQEDFHACPFGGTVTSTSDVMTCG